MLKYYFMVCTKLNIIKMSSANLVAFSYLKIILLG